MRGENALDIVPECYVDTNLTETLTGFICNHQKGCPAVAKQMKEKMQDRFALGIIDKDKRKVSYADEFELLAKNDSLELLKHPQKPHYIIYIKPAVERFIFKAVEELNLKLSDFKLPDDFEAFKRESKNQDTKKDSRFKQLFKALSNASDMQLLRNLIVYLQANPYSAIKEVIKDFFIPRFNK